MKCYALSLVLVLLVLVPPYVQRVHCENNTTTAQAGRYRSPIQTVPLFPRQKSWCKATDIKQIVQMKGCKPESLKNKACVGQCYSYSLPQTLPRDSIPQGSLKYCDWCRPSSKTWRKVSLQCPGRDVPQVDKLVEIIFECECQTCCDDGDS